MNNDNKILKDMQDKITKQIDSQKTLWSEEQIKAKALFDDLRQEGINNFEQVKTNIQKHIEEVNKFGQNLQSQFKSQPFDFQSFFKVISDYQTKQIEVISEATKNHTQKLNELQNKLSHDYKQKEEKIKTDIANTIDTAIDKTKEVVNTITKQKVAKKVPVAKTAKKTVATKTPAPKSKKITSKKVD